MEGRLDTRVFRPLTCVDTNQLQTEHLPGYDTLRDTQPPHSEVESFQSFSPNTAYKRYMNIHKVFVGQKGGRELASIAHSLQNEWLPDYLDAGGWAAAESALVSEEMPTTDRMDILDIAESCWERALINQNAINSRKEKRWLLEDAKEFRQALNLAYLPLIRSIVAGDATKKTREKTFADTLAIAQASVVQSELATTSGNPGAVGPYIGFGWECVAHLAFLYINNPKYLPIPSSYRAGTGYEYRSQTHDMTIINQHWGEIKNIIPVEIKARMSKKHKERYQALIIKGRMHLAIPGEKRPRATLDAFARCYDGTADPYQHRMVEYATSKVQDLLTLYREGECPDELFHINSITSFHKKDKLAEKYKEFTP